MYSAQENYIQYIFLIEQIDNRSRLPGHVFPSPENPALHAHLYDPCILLHVALAWQLCELVEHSSISKEFPRKQTLVPWCLMSSLPQTLLLIINIIISGRHHHHH